jgi:hypothetical protein
MSQPKTGRYGKIQAPVNDGILFTNVALTKVASITIGNKVYVNRFFQHASGYWNGNPAYKPTFRLQGIIGEASITPTGVNNEVSVNGFNYYKDNGAVQTAAADASVTVTRPAGAVAKWNLIILTLSTGAISAVAGTDAADATFLNTFGTGAGQIPVVTSDQIIIGAVKLTSSSAAAVSPSEITYVDGNNVLLQERSDIPGGKENLLEGGVMFDQALLACHTGGTTRAVYATFYSQESVLADVADLINWKLSSSSGVTTMPGKGDNPAYAEVSSTETTTGSVSKYMVGRGMFDLFRKRVGYLKLFQDDRDSAEYYEAAVVWSSFDENNDESAIVNNLNFTVNGFLERRGAS